MASKSRPIFEFWPQLEADLGFLSLGDFPTRVQSLQPHLAIQGGMSDVYVKRDDLTSSVYGGNKVRTLEALWGQARREGREVVIATGAYGSNHAVATLLHARRVGFRAGVLLFPQPFSQTAMANLRVSATHADELTDLLHWSALPYAMWRRARQTTGVGPFIMPPGGATPRGCLGFLSAGLELAMQIDAGEMPPPDEVVLALGSTCSTAGLLVGLRLAARLGLGLAGRTHPERGLGEPPLLVAVRVTPWPVTSEFRILRLARRLSTWLLEKTRDPLFALSRNELARGLALDGTQLGAGYGRTTHAGLSAMGQLSACSFALDTCYSAKSAAALLERARHRPRVRLFWCTKSSAPLPAVPAAKLALAPARMLSWLERGSSARGD
jgi:pyridoxal-phosphate dependent enzyme